MTTATIEDVRLSRSHGLPKPRGVVVIGANYTALGLVRSLGRHGIPVVLLKRGDATLAASSRYVTRMLRWPEGIDDVDFLISVAENEKLQGWLLLPTADDAVGLVARFHERLATQYTLTTLPWTTLERVCNKYMLHELAETLRIDQPWTFCPPNSQELEAVDCPFPLIIKPAIREVSNPLTLAKAWRVNNRKELIARYDEASQFMPPELLMIQEIVPGGGDAQFSFAALCSEGRVLASVVARRARQFPIDFGLASTLVETIQDSSLNESATRLLSNIGMTGLVEVEFKRDPAGKFKLLDVNPRVWGWHSLCARAGVDFPYLLWLMVRGEVVPHVEAVPGVSWMRLSTDLPTALKEIVRGNLSLKSYIRSLLGSRHSPLIVSDDPVPGLLEIPLIAYLIVIRAFRRNF